MYHQLEDCLLRKARIHLNTIVFAERTFPSQITQLVDWAESRDKVPELLSWLRKCNGDNGDLVGLYNEFSTSDETLEKLVVQSTKLFVEPVQFREQMAAMERRVCRIEAVINEVEVLATGFLVGPNLLLTNYHVIEDSKFGSDESKVAFRFNYKVQENGSVVGGSTATLANDWKVAWSITEEMDYAIVRLDRDVGRDPQGDFLVGTGDLLDTASRC